MDRRQLPEGWKVKKLGEICTIIAGQSPEGQYYNQERIGLPFYQGKKEFGDKFIKAPQTWTQKITKEAEKGDILMSVRAPVGPINFATEKICIGRGLAAIKAGDKIDNYFLFYELLSKQNEIKGNEGAVFPSINKSQIENIQFQFPSLDEQKRIVAILDEAFEGIDQAISNTEKNLANARELFDSYLNKIFTQKGDGWIEKTLGEVCDFLNGFAFKSDDVVKDSDVQLIRMGNLYQNILDIERNPVFYPDEFKEKFSRYVLLEGDLIMSLTGTVDKEDYGYTVEVPEIEKTLLLNQRIAKFINIDSDYVDKNFFLYLLRSNSFLSALYKSSRGVRQANLSSSSMKKLTISLPPLDSQKSLVFIFRRLENETQKLETIYRQKLAALNELKQSILQKAFTGQLTSKNC